MNDKTRILIVEDLVSDYELAQREIRKVVKNPSFKRMDNQTTLLKVLADFQPDLIISDYNLPDFNGMDVLKLVRENAPLTPLIIWTGSISEDVAVECMKAGANNYVLKENLKRLGPAVVHALEEGQLQMERRQAEEKSRVIFENSPVGIFQSTPDGRFISVNPAMARIYGYSSPEDMIQSIADVASQVYADPADRHEFTKLFEEQDIVEGFEGKNLRRDGTPFWTVTSARAIRSESEQILYYEGFLQDITTRKEAEQALINSESRFRGLTENGLDSISLLAADGTLLWVTPSMTRILDHNPEDFLGRNMFEIMHPEDKGWAYDLFLRLAREAGSREHRSFRLRHADGTWRWVEAVITNMLDEPGVNAIVVNYRDVTDRKNAEQALQESEERFRLIAQNAEDILLTMDMDLRLTYVSPAVERALGYMADEILSSTPEQFLTPESYAAGLRAFQEEVENIQSQPNPNYARLLEMEFCRKNGSTFWVEMKFSFFRNPDGRPTAILGVGRDITKRKLAEEKLQESEIRLIQALSTAQMSVWEWNLQTNDILWSPEFYAITGIEESGFDGTFDGYTDLIHPEDAARVRQAAEKAVAENTMFAEEFRIIRPDGEVRWLANLGHAEYGRSNTSLRMIGTVQDITARKQAEVERQALLDIMRGVAMAKDLPEFLQLIHHSIGKVIYAENFFVVIHHRDTGLFEEIYSVDQYDPPAPPSKLEKSITSYVFRTGEPLLLTQERFDELAAAGEVELVGTNSASWLGVPLKTPDGTIGVMVVQDYENQNRYSERDRNFLASIAAQVSLAIERKQAELELHQKNDDLALLNTINEAVIQGRDLDSTVELLARELKRIFSTEGNSIFSTIYMLTPDRQTVRMQKYFFPPELAHRIEKLIGFAIPTIEIPVLEGGYFHRAMTSGRSTITSDPQTIQAWIAEFTETQSLHPLVRKAVRKLVPQIHKLLNINSMIVVPLISEEEVIGFLDVSNSSLFTASDLKRIGNIGSQLTAVVQRQQANEKIRRSEKFLQSIQNALSASIAILDESGTIVQVNSAWREFGEQNSLVHPEYCVGLNYLEICDTARGADSDEAPVVAQAIRAVMAGQRSEARLEYPCHAPGGKRWFTLHITKFEDGNNIWVVLAHENITEQKLAEETLIQSQARYQNLFDSSPIPLWEEDYSLVKKRIDDLLERGVTDLQSYLSDHPNELVGLASLVKVTDVNRASVELFHAKQKSDLLKDLILLWGTDNLSQFQGEILDLMSPSKRFSWEGPDHTLDGQPLEVIVNGSIPPGYEDTWSKVIVSISDITERKRAEQKLQASEERFRQLAENIEEVFWMTDARTGKELYMSPASEKIWGHTPEYLMQVPDAFMGSILPEDKPIVLGGLNRERNGEKVEMEYRITRSDGSVRWVWDRAFPIFGADGRVKTLAGIAADITERKQAEEALLFEKERFERIVATVPGIICSFRQQPDGSTSMPFASSIIEDIYGIKLEDVRDSTAPLFERIHPEDVPGIQNTIAESARTMLPWQAEYRYFHPIKGEIWIEGKSMPVREPDGGIIWHGFITDVTARKQVEGKLRASEARYHSLFENLVDGFALHEIITDDQGQPVDYVFLEVNPAFEKLTGLSAREVVGRRVTEVLTDSENERFIPRYGQVALTGQPIRFQEYSAPLGRHFDISAYSPGDRQFAVTFTDITESKQADEALRDSEERFSNAFEFAPIGIALVSLQGRWLKVNRSLCNLLGYTDQELATKTFQEITHSDDLDSDLDNLNRLLAGEMPSYQMEKRYLHKSGEIVWVLLSVSLLRDRGGRPQYFIAQIQDITQRKRADQELTRRAEETSALLETSQALTNLDLNVTLHSIGNSAKNLFAADGCRVFLMQPDGESLRCVLALGENFTAFSDIRIRLGEGVTGAVAASGQGEIVNEMQNDLRAVQVPGTQEEEEAIIFAPLKERDRTIGVLSVRRSGSDQPFESADLELLEAFASMAASAVSNARLFEEAQRRLAELEALYENGLAVGQLLDPRRIGERIIDTFTRHLSWHHVTIRLIRPGTDELELIAFSQPGLNEENRVETEHHFNRMISRVGQGMSGWVVETGKPVRAGNVNEYPHYVPTYPHIQSGLYMPLMVGERVIGVISVESEEADALTAQDERLLATLANQAAIAFENARLYQSAQQEITERKRIENELRESQERYRLLIETSPDGIIMMGMDGTIQFGNQQMAGLFNVENPAELFGTNILSLFPPEQRGHIEQNIGNHKLEDGPQDGHWLMRRDGSRFYGELRSSSLRNEKGEEYAIIAQLRDVTERKQAQEALREERQRFLDLFENSPNPTWLEDFTAVVAWMDELKTLGIIDLGKYLHENPDEYRVGVGLIHILNVNHAAVIVNGARDKNELIDKVHDLLLAETPSHVMIHELEMIWQGNTSFGFEMSSPRMDGTLITGIQRVYIPINNGRPDYARVIVTSTDITERVEIERKLRASELHYRELADSITDVLFELDHDLRYTHWNKASELLMGIPAYNAIGKSMYDVFGDSEEQLRIGSLYKNVLEENQPKTFETEILINGQRLVFEINANPSMRGVSVVARNITERKLSETLMQKRFELVEYSARHSFEEVLQKTIDMVSDVTGSHIGFMHFIAEDQITIELQARSTETLRDFCVAEGIGMHDVVDHAGVWADAIRERRSIIHNDYESLPNKKGLPQGHSKVVREMIIPIIRNERIVAVLGVGNKEVDYTRQDRETAERFADYAWDITERKQMESALAEERNQLARRVEERTADLSRANSNLARALRVKDEFLANMSHELRTPLNAILGLSESLGEQVAGPLNEKQQKYLSTINESGHHLLSLINDILDLAKIEAGQITLDINKVDINSVCQASLRMVKQLAQKKNLEVQLEIESDFGLMWADERRLKQMIVNLLSNAVKFTPELGRIGLEVHGDRAGNKVSITVWDTGIGIKDQDLERLFKPFVQLDSGLAREATGTGLGLALVAQMARLHGGSVHALSQMGEGSRFIIQLPWEPAMASDIVARLRNTGKFRAIAPNASRPTILLIEDTREVVMMLVDYLEMAGFKMVTAQDGIEGLEQAKLSRPDLILMDIQMPRMDGFEATQKLRNDPEFKDVPIIALTALAMPNDRQRCLDAGMDEYISKPVNLKTLAKTIQKLLFQDQEANPS